MKQNRMLCRIIFIYLCLYPAYGFGGQYHSRPLIITNSATYPPFAFIDRKGIPQGLLIDLWKEWAKENDVDVRFKLVDWNDSLELIRQGKADIHAGLFKTKSRKSYMYFSDGLFQLTTRMFISNKLPITRIEDIGDIEVGVVKGGYEEEYIRFNYPHIHVRLFANNKLLVEAACFSKIDIFIADYPVGMYYLSHYGIVEKFRILQTLYCQCLYSAVKKGNRELLTFVNNGLRGMDSSKKELIIQKWIRSEEVLPSWLIPSMAIAVIVMPVTVLLIYVHILGNYKKRLEIQVTERTDELREKNIELEKALEEVRTLSGMLPICASCKKIRDDKGYWNQIESYISKHSEVEFSHSICPECAQRLYPESITRNLSNAEKVAQADRS